MPSSSNYGEVWYNPATSLPLFFATGLTTLTAYPLPVGFKINFGGFSVAPTVTVVGG